MKIYPWQHDLFSQLTAPFLRKRGHHALLFKAEQGIGAGVLMKHFAHWLLCQERGAEPCGQCKSCLLWQSGNHPDFHLLTSIDNKEIGVDAIREIVQKLQTFSQQGGNRVVMISPVERLTEAAANALLKTLEEPPENVYFLLRSPRQGTILPTIHSRCQAWFLHTPPIVSSLQWLQQEFPQETVDNLEKCLMLCHFRPLACRTFIEEQRLAARTALLRQFWLFLTKRDLWAMFKAFDNEKPQQLQQLAWINAFFQDALKAKLGVSEHWQNADLAAGVVKLSERFSAKQLLNGYQQLNQTASDLQKINAVNQELMLLDCLTKLIAIFEGNTF